MRRQRSCTLTDEVPRRSRCLALLVCSTPGSLAHYITNALKAKELFIKDVNYIVRDGEAVIVDEFTGRVMPGAAGAMASTRRSKPRKPYRSSRKPRPSLRSLPELALPPPGRHDRHRQDRRGGVREDVLLETTIVPTNWCGPARTGPIRSTKPKRPNGGRWPTKPRTSIKRGPVLVGTIGGESELLSSLLAEQEIWSICSTPNRRTWSANRRSSPRPVGPVQSPSPPTWPAGTDIILGGNSDYMARLKPGGVAAPPCAA